MKFCKALFVFIVAAGLGACSTNPATGKNQFTGLMSQQQEIQVGATENEKIAREFGFYDDQKLQAYVNEVGKRVSSNTERPDVVYKFFVLDSPIVNAFALPGGYVYVSRGLLALANNEAELAAVLAHETGHITARHAAERYSQAMLTTLGVAVISAAVDSTGVSQALGVGSDLFLSSYSRGQEAEADSLGLRYMSRGGYDPVEMPAFLQSLQRDTALEEKEKGQGNAGAFNYFSTHPATAERVSSTLTEAKKYPPGGDTGQARYMGMIDGLVYGDSVRQGFVRGQDFFHPGMGFAFSVPAGFKINNAAEQVSAVSPSGAVILFDIAANPGNFSPSTYLTQSWMKDDKIAQPEDISVNGMKGAVTGFNGDVNGRPADIRLIVIDWKGQFARFQIAIPKNADAALTESLQRSTYSFRPLSAAERASLKPRRVKLVTAKAGDTVSALAVRQPFGAFNEEKFRVLNALAPADVIRPGQSYKTVTE